MAKLSKQELREAILGDESLSDDVKGQLLDLLKTPTFGLVWEEKTEDVIERLRDELPILKEVKERAIISEDKAAPNHVLIEADNLEALVALTYTHAGKFDAIYIDPPYNTGAKNWKYNNDYVDDTDAFRHSKWVSMMEHRLVIAKELLSDEGILVLTIDDYEIENITLLLDAIFGEDNRLATIVIKNNPSGRSTVTGVSISHEYALFYTKSKFATLGRLPRNDKQIARYKESDEQGYFEWVNFRKHGGYKEDAPSMYFPIYIKKDGSSFRIPKLEWQDSIKEYNVLEEPNSNEFISLPIDENGRPRRWKWSLERTLRETSDMTIRQDRDKQYAVYIKARMKDEGMLPLSVWDDKLYSSTEYGANLLSSILGGKLFDYPKSLYAVIDSLKVAHVKKDSLILDFFAGSGTTMHATMMLNQEDGGHRQCFLVTNNESNICEEVTYERNKRVILGYTTPKGEQVAGLTGNSLRYYKVEHTPRKHTHENKMLLAQAMTEMLQIKWNAYDEPERFGSLRVKPRYMRYFSGDEDVLIIYVPEIIPYIVKEIKAMDNGKKLHVYVAADGNYAYSEEFGEVIKRIELASIPSAYYNAIKSILPAPTEEKGEYVPSEEDEELLAHADKHDFQD